MMKLIIYCNVLALLILISLPIAADAFSRRSHDSEVGPSHVTPLNHDTHTRDISPQAVPEPPVLLFMGIGIVVFGACSMIIRYREQAARRDK
jgi:hypothetical protein